VSGASEALEEALGYSFRDRGLFVRALTHKSRAYEDGCKPGAGDNEQLEFLGDSILGFLVSEALVKQFPAWPEGRLSRVKAHLVSAAHLHFVAQDLGLGEHLLLGRGEELSGGRAKRALLADGLEALIAALYLDGGIERARAFVARRVIGGLNGEELVFDSSTDYKSELQQLTQSRHLPQPRYSIVEERGPEHSKTFTVEVRVGREWTGRAEGLSKKTAGQQAARQLLNQLSAREA
jgi:ribonuclease-3